MLTTLLISGLMALSEAPLAEAAKGAGFLKFPITGHKPKPNPISSKRQNEVDLDNQQMGTSYTIELNLGTPDQPVEVQLDTGSTDLWVNPNCANAGSARSIAFCNSLPRFDSSKSSTFKDLGSSYQLTYGGGNASIEWVTDNVDAGSATLTGQRFGVAANSHSEPFGILGVGPKTFANQPDYTYFIDNLVAQGFTDSRAFSLDLRSIDSPDGAIIFGGVDTAKYEGALEKLPIIPQSSAPNGNRYWVTLDSITLQVGGAATPVSTKGIPVLLDSGTTLTRLPAEAYTALGASFPTAKLDPEGSGFYLVDCNVAKQAGTVDFTFAGKTIKVLFKDVIWIVDATTGLCVIGAQGIPTAESPQVPILGDSFLRAAYAVFDQDNKNIHLAQAANCGSNLVAIGKGADAVPSVTGKCGGGSSSTTSSSTTSTPTSVSSTTTGSGTSITYTPTSSVPTTSPYPTAPPPTLTSTYYETSVYTVTSCPPTVTNCPVGHVTTETYTSYTTYCPESYPTDKYPTEKPGGEKPYPTEKPGGEKPYPTEKPGGEKPYPTEKPGGEKPYPTEKPGGEKPYPTEKPGGEKPYPTEKPGGEKPYPTEKPGGEGTYPTIKTSVKPVPSGTGAVYPTAKPPVTAGVGHLVANAGAGLAIVALAAVL